MLLRALTERIEAFTSAPQSQTAAVLTDSCGLRAPQGQAVAFALHDCAGLEQRRCAGQVFMSCLKDSLNPSFQEARNFHSNQHARSLPRFSLQDSAHGPDWLSGRGRPPAPGALLCWGCLTPSLPALSFILYSTREWLLFCLFVVVF